MNKFKLWYDKPGNQWEETLPIGNGSLGGMIFGGIEEEKIGLNQETLWSGYYRDKNNPLALENLETVRQLIFDEKYEEADDLVHKSMLGENNESYLPLGNLMIKHENLGQITGYQRELDIENAIATVSFLTDGNKVTREMFASYPQQAIFIQLKGSKLDFTLNFESELVHKVTEVSGKAGLTIKGQCPEHVDPEYVNPSKYPVVQGTKGQKFSGEITVVSTDGEIDYHDGKLQIKEANQTLIKISFVNSSPNTLVDYQLLKAEHIEDYQKIYKKVYLDLGPQVNLPTDQRLARLKEDESDPGLYALYFQYGRYLLIASSRKGSLPATLQGIWAWEVRSPWSSNYTININLQMNYWLAQTCNLQECLPPYFDLLKRIVPEGQKTAKINYGARGFVAHHNLDYWLNTSPVGINYGDKVANKPSAWWSMWPMGGAWLCQELYKNYEYNQDLEFLKDTAYPILRECALFLCDWLIEKEGVYETCPSSSPENQFLTPDGVPMTLTKSTALDIMLIQEVFRDFERTCMALEIEDELLIEIGEKASKLAPLKIGEKEQLLEWDQEFEEREPGHRHLNIAYGIYPSTILDNEEELRKAAVVAFNRRIEQGSGHTGWSCAWVLNIYAHLQDSENAYKYLKTLLTKSTYNNLWDAHPPFQIDGNFGGAAGIANMLVNEAQGELRLLPALPKEFAKGKVTGLRLKNNKIIDLEWENGQVKDYKIRKNKKE